MTQTVINLELKGINDKIKHLETVIAAAAKTGSLGMLERSHQIREGILREFSTIQDQRDTAIAALKDNLKEHLWSYSDEDIAVIREEKTQLVTAAEFAEVHMEKLCIEKKLATAVKAFESIKERTERDELDEYYRERNHDVRNDAVKALAEIGGEDD